MGGWAVGPVAREAQNGQVAGRNERTFDELCLLDYYYLCNRSAALAARILWRTVCLLIQQTGLKSEAQHGGQ